MYLKQIVLDGFKSYAQRTEISGFDPQFNAITGLNGSGKSNILDSICFLLGISNLSQVTRAVVCMFTTATVRNIHYSVAQLACTYIVDNIPGTSWQSTRACIQVWSGWSYQGNSYDHF